MSIVSTTLCYPNPSTPLQGIFVQRRLAAIHAISPLIVVAPVLRFPVLVPAACDLRCGLDDTPPVWHPRMFYFPGIMKKLDGRFFARALQRCLDKGALNMGIPDRRPDLIDAHFVWPDGVGAWQVARRLGVPFVCTIRGKLVSQIADVSKRRQIREMLLGADALMAVSQSLAELANEVAGRDLDVTVIPNGIDGDVFRRFGNKPQTERGCGLRASLGWSEDARYVVSIGHLQALKGFHRLLEVWPDIRRRLGDVRLVLVGGGVGEPAYERSLRRQVVAAGLEGAVTFVGRVEPRRVAELLNAADLFALASCSEGWCNAIAESLACGCPVVATDVGGNRELVGDSSVGTLVPLGDREALAEVICSALGTTWDRTAIAEAGGGRDWQQVARECVDVFERAAGNSPGVA